MCAKKNRSILDGTVSARKNAKFYEVKVNYTRAGDTLPQLRAPYIQCSPSKRTFTAKLLTVRLFHITPVKARKCLVVEKMEME